MVANFSLIEMFGKLGMALYLRIIMWWTTYLRVTTQGLLDMFIWNYMLLQMLGPNNLLGER